MDTDEFRRLGHALIDRIADYWDGIEERPVRSRTKPGDIVAALPAEAPETGEGFDRILADFDHILDPGLTNWAHPRFFAYFPANISPPAVLGEVLAAGLGQQAMLWETSPAANELEAVTMAWLGKAIGLPEAFKGTIQDSASTATLCALLAAREKALQWSGNTDGLSDKPALTVYASAEAHSSIDKAARIAGYGDIGLRRVETDAGFRMKPDALDEMITLDRAEGRLPAAVIASIGATGIGAVDPVRDVAQIAARHGVYLHVDAAWAGSALVCPEFRAVGDGIELADSLVFNPHKWMGVNFDCSAHFVKDPQVLRKALSILPAYLVSEGSGAGPEYRDWTIPLGRRFRALKLWFALRSYGLEAIRDMIRRHVAWAEELEGLIAAEPGFALAAPRSLALVAFRLTPEGRDGAALDTLNDRLIATVNETGFTYLTRTLVDGRVAVRVSIGNLLTERRHVLQAWDHIRDVAKTLA
ncbi:pyridoxal phosphate-dependent decarboxylase family protein [Microbaculum sp. FT89]|uniref:pyridoxal phosphate-dependent decarboxylase family protein n=1 Tax=Microbaculum sp. FT89 TaxID=3447298 RepID=UPI003F5307A3